MIEKSAVVGFWTVRSRLAPFYAKEISSDLIQTILSGGLAADCDLDRKKHANLLTLVPVVSVMTVLEHYLIPEDCEKKRAMIEAFAFEKNAIASAIDRETKIAMLESASGRCLREIELDESIAIEITLKRASAVKIQEYKLLMKAIKNISKKPSAFASQIRDRGDILHLPDTKALGIDGDLAWMRNLWQEPASSVAIRTSEIRGRRGERLARLASPHRYRLTQLLAQVFSDIGLPDMPNTIEQQVEEAFRDV